MIYFNEEVTYQIIINVEDESEFVREQMDDFLYDLNLGENIDSWQDYHYAITMDDKDEFFNIFECLECKLESIQEADEYEELEVI